MHACMRACANERTDGLDSIFHIFLSHMVFFFSLPRLSVEKRPRYRERKCRNGGWGGDEKRWKWAVERGDGDGDGKGGGGKEEGGRR